MARELKEIRRTVEPLLPRIVYHDYDTDPFAPFCRKGKWVGYQRMMIETVVVSFEHPGEDLYVFWKVEGEYVTYGGGMLMGQIGNPPVHLQCPVDGYNHRLQITSTSGVPISCVTVQPVFSTADAPFVSQDGPQMEVCVSGSSEVIWPASKLAEEADCLKMWTERIRKAIPRLKPVRPHPIDPIADYLLRLSGESVVRLKSLIETLEMLDVRDQAEFTSALESELMSLVIESSTK